MMRPSALLLVLALLGGAGEAAAHASLVGTVPADGTAWPQAPAEVVLQFDEPVAPLAMRLVDDRGAQVGLPGGARAEGTRVRVPLPPLRSGAFVFSYRVVSADSHPVAGSIAITIGKAAAAPAASSTPDAAPDAALVAARLARDLLLLVAAGAALFAALVGGFPRQRRVVIASALGAATAGWCELGLQGFTLAGPDASLHEAFRAGWDTTAGRCVLALCAGAVALVPGAWRANRGLLLAGAVLAAGSVALTGHAATGSGMPLVAAHALLAAFWLGSLVALRLSLHGASLANTLRRFSRLAMPGVVLLVAAGAAFAAMQLDSPRDLVESAYGRLVSVKAVLLLALLALAAVNRFLLTQRIEQGDAAARTWLRRTITGELALVALVLLAAAVLSRTPPPSATPLTRDLAGAGTLTVTPGRAGRNLVVVSLRDANVQEVRLLLSHRASGIEPIERTLARASDGTFRHGGTELAFAGSWDVVIDARIGDFDKLRLQAQLAIR